MDVSFNNVTGGTVTLHAACSIYSGPVGTQAYQRPHLWLWAQLSVHRKPQAGLPPPASSTSSGCSSSRDSDKVGALEVLWVQAKGKPGVLVCSTIYALLIIIMNEFGVTLVRPTTRMYLL